MKKLQLFEVSINWQTVVEIKIRLFGRFGMTLFWEMSDKPQTPPKGNNQNQGGKKGGNNNHHNNNGGQSNLLPEGKQ